MSIENLTDPKLDKFFRRHRKQIELENQMNWKDIEKEAESTRLSPEDFAEKMVNRALDQAIRILFLCQADRCDHCEEKIRKIEALKV
jgi:hypothetical protein